MIIYFSANEKASASDLTDAFSQLYGVNLSYRNCIHIRLHEVAVL